MVSDEVKKVELVDGELELTLKKIYEEVWACRNVMNI